MRILRAAPPALVDPRTGTLALGSFAGPLPPVALEASAWARAVRRKKWFFVAIASKDHWISCAIVDTGYAATAFAYVFDARARRMVADETTLASSRAIHVTDDPHALGTLARFASGRRLFELERRGDQCGLYVRTRGIEIDVAFDETSAPRSISAVSALEHERVSTTEKRALMQARGELRLAGARSSLDGALVGYDYTHGLLPRRTRWKWAFAMGSAKTGQPVAFNLVEGFVGEDECAAFGGGDVHPLGEPRIAFDARRVEQPWRIVGEGVDLTFDVGAVHEQRTNLVVVRSRFVQPVGTFRGTLELGGRPVEVEDLPGVVEDQDVVW